MMDRQPKLAAAPSIPWQPAACRRVVGDRKLTLVAASAPAVAAVSAAVALLTIVGGAFAAEAREHECGKPCLAGITERYLDAMASGALAALPLAPNVRATSNSRVTEIGAGDTWRAGITVVNRHTFLDPLTQTAIFFGTIAGEPAEDRAWWHYAVRLSVDAEGRLFEVEEQSARRGFQTADRVETPFKEAAIFDAVLPEDERIGAAALVRVADRYWDGLTTGEGRDIPFGPDCQRTEFGKYSTNSTLTHDRAADPEFVPQPRSGQSCRAFFGNERFRWPTDNRRYYVVDEARGVVVGIGQLHRFGEDGNAGLTLIEAFKIVNGQIEFLWAPAFTFGVEASGWPDWERPE